jgi:hypothetical protein
MSTPTLRDDEIAMTALPHANTVTTRRKMPRRRYHYVAGAWTIWRRSGGDSRELARMAVHTMCRDWITLPNLVDGDVPVGEICDLCMLQQSRVWAARDAADRVDF